MKSLFLFLLLLAAPVRALTVNFYNGTTNTLNLDNQGSGVYFLIPPGQSYQFTQDGYYTGTSRTWDFEFYPATNVTANVVVRYDLVNFYSGSDASTVYWVLNEDNSQSWTIHTPINPYTWAGSGFLFGVVVLTFAIQMRMVRRGLGRVSPEL